MYSIYSPCDGKPGSSLELVTKTDNASLAVYASRLPGWIVILGL